MKAFAALYRGLDAATSTKSKQQALVDYFRRVTSDARSRASAAWAVYFLAGGKPRQTAPTRLLRRLAIEESGLEEWLFEECYHSVGDLAETLTLLLPETEAAEDAPLDVWMNERLLPLRVLDDETKFARLRDWSRSLSADERFAFFKLITGAFRVGVSKLQVVRALAELSGADEKRMAQRMMGFTQAGRSPRAEDFDALMAPGDVSVAAALDLAQPYPFYLAHSLQRTVDEIAALLGPVTDWIAEWKFDGIRAQFVNTADGWSLWSRGEDLITEAYPEFQALSAALPPGTRLDGELVVFHAASASADDLTGLRTFASLQQRLGRKQVSAKTLRELPVFFIAYDLLERGGRDLREEPQCERRAALEEMVAQAIAKGLALGSAPPLKISPLVVADSWTHLAARRDEAAARGVEGLMLKARQGAYGVCRRKGSDRENVWWKWKLDPMSVDAVLIYAQRGRGRRSGVYSDYTFAVWNDDADAKERALVPFAKAYSGLSDQEMREVDAIIRKTTIETFGPVRSVTPTLVFELGFEGIAISKRHKSGVAVRFPRMLRWRRDKPVAEASTLSELRQLLRSHE